MLLRDIDSDESLSKHQAQLIATKINDALDLPYNLDNSANYHQCSCSIGLLLFKGDSLSTDELLRYADAAMYQAKAEQQSLCWHH